MAKNEKIERVFQETSEFFEFIQRNLIGDENFDEMQRDVASQGAIDLLNKAANAARHVPAEDEALKLRFAECAQQVIDFLEGRGHPNNLKEIDAIGMIHKFAPVRIPDAFKNSIP